jgi:hypothetical protein
MAHRRQLAKNVSLLVVPADAQQQPKSVNEAGVWGACCDMHDGLSWCSYHWCGWVYDT